MRMALIGNQATLMLSFRGPLIRDLVAKGIEVFAFAPDYDETTRNSVRAMGAKPRDYRLARTGMNPLVDAAAMAHLIASLRSLRPEVSLCFAVKPVVYGTLAAKIAGVPRRYAVIEGLGHAFMESATLRSRLLRTLVSGLYRAALRHATSTFFLNADDRSDFVDAGLVAAEKATLVGAIGVDLSEWRAVPPCTNPMTFLFVGRLLREKGLLEFIEAARQIRSLHQDVRFVVLGDVDSNPSSVSTEQIHAWVAVGLVDWPGRVANVAPWLARSSVFVLPSYREGVPRSTQEAMAMGRPVVTTDVPGCRDTVEHMRNGFLVPAKNADALAAALLAFVKNPHLVGEMGRRSRQLAEERFDAKAASKRLTEAMGL